MYERQWNLHLTLGVNFENIRLFCIGITTRPWALPLQPLGLFAVFIQSVAELGMGNFNQSFSPLSD
jgi:hypothetical protein